MYSSQLSGPTISTPLVFGEVVGIRRDLGYIVINQDFNNYNISSGDFITFSKNIKVNESTLKGYYADVTFENASNKRAELFAISSEIALSSK